MIGVEAAKGGVFVVKGCEWILKQKGNIRADLPKLGTRRASFPKIGKWQGNNKKAASVDADGLKTALLVDYGITRKQARNHTD